MKHNKRNLLTILLLVLLASIMGCTQPDPMESLKGLNTNDRNVVATISLPISDSVTRTILPGKMQGAESYKVTLTVPGQMKAAYTIDNLTAEGNLIKLEDIKIGTYAVSVEGYNTINGAKTLVYTGNSTENLVIKMHEVVNINIDLYPVTTDKTTGSISVTFDWSAIVNSNSLAEGGSLETMGPLKKAINDGELRFEIYVAKKDNEAFTRIGAPVIWTRTADETSKTCIFNNIPVGKGLNVKFAIKDKEDILLLSGFDITADVYTGQTSYWKNNANAVCDLILSNVDDAYSYNLSDIMITYPEINPETSIKVFWDEVEDLDKIIFKIGKFDPKNPDLEDPAEIEKTYEQSTVSPSEQNHIVFTDLIQNKVEPSVPDVPESQQYYIKSRVFYNDGSASDTIKWLNNDGTGFATKVLVDDITLTEKSAAESITLQYGESFTMQAAVSPVNATFQDLRWTSTSETNTGSLKFANNDFLGTDVTVTADQPGVAVINVVNLDDVPEHRHTSTYSKNVFIKLGTPTILNSLVENNEEAQLDNISLQWTKVDYAESYIIYRSVNNGPFEKLNTVTGTTYPDKDITTGNTYAYQVQAIAPTVDEKLASYPDFSVASNKSPASASVEIKTPTIKMTPIEIQEESFKLQDNTGHVITNNEGYAIVKVLANENITITLDEAMRGYDTYTWSVNSHTLNTVSGTFEKAQNITLNDQLPYIKGNSPLPQSLTLKVTKDGNTYSMLIRFTIVKHPVKALKWSSTFNVEKRYSTEETNLQITASVSDPKQPTMKDIRYKLADQQNSTYAEINELTGKITIKAPAENIVFRAYSVENPSIYIDSDPVTFYKPTIVDKEFLVSEVNKIMDYHIKDANDNYFHYYSEYGDWWTDQGYVYKRVAGVNITPNHSTPQNTKDVGIKYTGFTTDSMTTDMFPGYKPSEIGSMTFNAKQISIYAYSWGAGFLGRDALSHIGMPGTDNKLIVDLPYNQGKVTIEYKSVIIYDGTDKKNSDPKAPLGKYLVTFEHDYIGSHTVMKEGVPVTEPVYYQAGTEYEVIATKENRPYTST